MTSFRAVAVVCLAGFLWPAPLAAGEIARKTLLETKAATVYVKVQFRLKLLGKGKVIDQTIPTTGSGFVIMVKGDLAYIATNHHVVQPARELEGNVQMVDGPRLVFHSGTSKERTVPAEILASDPALDLAILRVKTFADFPRPVPIDPRIELNETMGVYIFGFPFGNALADGGKNPAITVGKGSISSLREDHHGQLKHVQLDGDLNPGNSGGPIVDVRGHLVGVAVAKMAAAKRISLAIPPRHLADVLQGRVAEVDLSTSKIEKDRAEIRVEARLVDPFSKLKAPMLHYVQGPIKELPKPDEAGNFSPLNGAAKLELTRDKDRAGATFILPVQGKKGVTITYQTACVNAEGKTVYSPAAVHLVDLNTIAIAGLLTSKDPLYKEKSPHKVHAVTLEAGQNYVIDMVARPSDAAKVPGESGLDPYLYLEDPQGKVVAEDDDGGGYPSARIAVLPAKTDTYKIIATAFEGAGRYTVTLRKVADTKKIHAVGADGLRMAGNLIPADPVDGFLLSEAKIKAPSKVHQVRLEAGKKYVIDLVSKDFDCILRVENPSGQQLAWDDDGGEGLNSRLTFAPPAAGVYRLIATCLDSRPGNYTLSLRPE